MLLLQIYISAKRFAYSGTLYTELANALHVSPHM